MDEKITGKDLELYLKCLRVCKDFEKRCDVEKRYNIKKMGSWRKELKGFFSVMLFVSLGVVFFTSLAAGCIYIMYLIHEV